MLTRPNAAPNPRRVAAGRRNWAKRKGLTDAGREKLRQTALKHQSWRFSTGPRTPEGKAKVALNGKKRQKGTMSVREIQAELAEANAALAGMAASRRAAIGVE
jgi:hypothetical protein